MANDRRINYRLFNHLYKLYCPDKNLRFICFYCGLPAGTVDHVPPLSCVLDLRSEYDNINYIRVPSCQECNSFGTDEPHVNLYERQEFIKNKIKSKYLKYLTMVDWEDDEIEELGRSLKDAVKARMSLKYLIVYRLAYGSNKQFSIENTGYTNIDPLKILKYAKAEEWDKTLESVHDKTLSIKELNALMRKKVVPEKTKEKEPSPKVYLPYNEAKKRVKKLNLKNCSEYSIWRKNNKGNSLREQVPSVPSQYYKDYWKGWEEYLGPSYENINKKTQIKYRSILTYDNAKKYIRKCGINNSISYSNFINSNRKYRNILPASPQSYYKDEWEGWELFLGENYRNRNREKQVISGGYLSYEKAVKYIHSIKLTNAVSYQKARTKSAQMKLLVPACPPKYYKDEWLGWDIFIGSTYVNKQQEIKDNYLPYFEAIEFIKNYDIKSSTDYKNKRRTNKILSLKLPSNPVCYYKENWEGWKKFLKYNYNARRK